MFHRERNNTHLSELGRMMAPYLESVADSARAAKSAAISAKKIENVTLTLGAMCTIGPQLVADLIVRFQSAHPNVEVNVIDGEASAMIAALERGDLHLSLVGVPDDLPDCFHQLPVFSERFVIVLPPGHPWQERNAIRVADLDGEPYVGRTNCEVFRMVTEDFARRGVTTKKIFSSPRDDWVQKMIKAGLSCFGFFPEYCVSDTDLVVRPLIDPEYTRTIYLATVRRPAAFAGRRRLCARCAPAQLAGDVALGGVNGFRSRQLRDRVPSAGRDNRPSHLLRSQRLHVRQSEPIFR